MCVSLSIAGGVWPGAAVLSRARATGSRAKLSLAARLRPGLSSGGRSPSGGDKMTRPSESMTAAMALVFSGTAAMAQAPACGGLGAEADWIAGGQAASDIATADDALTRAAQEVPRNGEVVTLFSLGAAGTVRLEARAGAMGGDPVLELYDASGTMIVTDDDSGGLLDARAETELPAGDYCVLVRGFADSALTADIRVGRLEHAALTEGLRGGFFDPDGGADGPDFVGIQPCLPTTEATPLTRGPIDAALAQGGAQATATVTGTPITASRSGRRRPCRCARATRRPIPISTFSTATGR